MEYHGWHKIFYYELCIFHSMAMSVNIYGSEVAEYKLTNL